MKAFYTDQFVLPLPEGHRFPMEMYSLLRQQLVEVGIIKTKELHEPRAATDDEIKRAHSPEYLDRVCTGRITEPEICRIGFPWSLELVERSRRSSGATIAACRAALVDGFAVNLAGGTHHAFRDRGEGFSVFNDSVIAACAMQIERGVRQVIIIDCDVHQGNGTAAILADDPSIFTFSIHGANNFPFRKERSDLDSALHDNTGDNEYLGALQTGLRLALQRAKADLAIYLAGADPYMGDRLGRLAISKIGLAKRDRLVLEACQAASLPVAVTMAGGYARRVQDTVDIHLETVRTVAAMQQGR